MDPQGGTSSGLIHNSQINAWIRTTENPVAVVAGNAGQTRLASKSASQRLHPEPVAGWRASGHIAGRRSRENSLDALENPCATP